MITRSEQSLEQLLVDLHQLAQRTHHHLHVLLVTNHYLVRLLLYLLLSGVAMLALRYLDPFADVSQLVSQDHALLLIHVLLVEELNHLLEVRVLVQLAQLLHGPLRQNIHVLHDLQSVLQALVVERLRPFPHLLRLPRHDARPPLRRLLGLRVHSVEVD